MSSKPQYQSAIDQTGDIQNRVNALHATAVGAIAPEGGMEDVNVVTAFYQSVTKSLDEFSTWLGRKQRSK